MAKIWSHCSSSRRRQSRNCGPEMCQWKFLVLRYSANRSASSTFNAADRSFVASAPRSLGVLSGAARRSLVSSRIMVVSFRFKKTGLVMQHARQAGGELAGKQGLPEDIVSAELPRLDRRGGTDVAAHQQDRDRGIDAAHFLDDGRAGDTGHALIGQDGVE